MLISRLALPLANFAVASGCNPIGRILLKQFGPQFSSILERMLFSFLKDADTWRAQRVALVASIASDLVIKVLSDAHRPAPVKRAFRNMILDFVAESRREPLRQKYGIAPSFFVLDFTNRCNFSCYGCYANSYKEGDDLSFEVVDRIIQELKEFLGIHYVVLSGGEPFLRRRDIFVIARKHHDVAFMVYTNGSLLTPSVISELARLGNISPCLSVEGFEPETDHRRGRGHFGKIIQTMKQLKEAGIFFGFSATMTSQNADQLTSDEFIDFYIDQGCLYGWYFLYIPIGRRPDPSLMVSVEQRSRLASQVNRWRDLRKPIFIGDFWNDGPLVGGCIAAGRRYFHIDGAGWVKPCVFLRYGVANIHDILAGQHPKYASLKEVIINSPGFREFRELQKEISDYTRPCSIIDHPENLRQIAELEEVYPVKSTPDADLMPEIDRVLDQLSCAWADRHPREAYLQGSRFEHRQK